jgi:hypothetical protein
VPGQGLLEELQYEHYHNDYHHYYQRAYHPSPPPLATSPARHGNPNSLERNPLRFMRRTLRPVSVSHLWYVGTMLALEPPSHPGC